MADPTPAERMRAMPLDTLADYATDNAASAGHQAMAEMERRLIVALNESKDSAARWARAVTFLTLALVVLTVALICRA